MAEQVVVTALNSRSILLWRDRHYRVDTLFHDDDGVLRSITAELVEPKPGEKKWLSLEVVDFDALEFAEIH